MAKVGHFYNNSAHAVNIAVTTAYAVARSHNLTGLGTSNQGVSNKGYMLRTLYIKLDTLAGL